MRNHNKPSWFASESQSYLWYKAINRRMNHTQSLLETLLKSSANCHNLRNKTTTSQPRKKLAVFMLGTLMSSPIVSCLETTSTTSIETDNKKDAFNECPPMRLLLRASERHYYQSSLTFQTLNLSSIKKWPLTENKRPAMLSASRFVGKLAF